ncbi:MAG: NUDIX hydrolase [Candidatus Omnitrophota bacterium]
MQKIKEIFKGKLLHLITKAVKLPNGYIANLEVVKHPGAVLIVPFLTKDKIIILRQLRPVVREYLYELPAGTLEAKELPLPCARRELIEETGYAAKKIVCIGKIYPAPGYTTEKIIIYRAEGLMKRGKLTEEDEIIKTFTITKTKVKRLFKEGKIIDAKTICALAMCGWL